MAQADIAALSPEQARALWQDYQQRRQLGPHLTTNQQIRRMPVESISHRPLLVVLDEDIDPPADVVSGGAQFGAATVAMLDASAQLADEGIASITVYNVWEGVSLTAGTLCVAMWLSGYWVIIAADCQPLGNW